MSGMIERVARAIAMSFYGHDETWSEMLPDARAAIEAMTDEDLRMELTHRKFLSLLSIDKNDCHQWLGSIDKRDGYSRFYSGSGKTISAHKFAWEYYNGPVPEGLVIDHLCRNRSCVNVKHMRCVTNAVNVLAGNGFTAQNAAKTECVKGHPLDESNIYHRPDGGRGCRQCIRIAHKKYKAKKRTAALAGAPGEG